MKILNYYMNQDYRMEIYEDHEEGGYTVAFPELRGCLTCGDTLEQAIENAQDAKRCWIEAALEEGIKIPEPKNSEDYSGQFKLRIPKALHKTLIEQSAAEGVSMNQYCVYLLAKGVMG